MTQVSFEDELTQSMRNAFREVADLTSEIGQWSTDIVSKLQRPPMSGTDQIQFLLSEISTVFTKMSRHVMRVFEIVKSNFQRFCSLPDTRAPDRTTENVSIREQPHLSQTKSSSAVAPFSVKLPPKRHTHMSAQTQSASSSLPKTPIQLSLLPPRLPLTHGKDMMMEDISTDYLEHTFFNDNHLDSASLKSFQIQSMRPTEVNQPSLDLERQQVVQSQDIADFHELEPETDDESHLMGWIAIQHFTEGTDEKELYKWLMEVIYDEFVACMKRGLHLADLSSDEPQFDLGDFTPFIEEIDHEVEMVKQSQCLPVRGNGPDTILCLDTSTSMCGEKFHRMTNVANQIIDGIEELATFEVMQGNIAVTTFGIQPKVALHLTNDYPLVRNVIDSLAAEGPSTLYRGLSMAFAACIANYANVLVNDVRLMARVIVLTDGQFSADDAKNENYEFEPRNLIMAPLAANLLKLSGIVCYCVQIGEPAESEILQILTKATHGKIFPDNHVGELARMPKHLFTATNLLRQFPDLVAGDKDARDNEDATLNALMDLESLSRETFGRDFSESERETVIALAKSISRLQLTKVMEPNEYLVEELNLQLFPVGTRVRRGPDWNPKDNQDTAGPGTVVCHNKNGTVAVLWDCGIIPLPYHCYEPCQVLSTDYDERLVSGDGSIQVGCKVQRGPAWTHGDDDGGQGSFGVVCLCTKKGIVTVRWPNRNIGKYRYGDEVTFHDTSDEQPQAEGYESNPIPIEFEPGNKMTLSSDARRYPKPYKNVNFMRYFTSTRDSNTQFLKQNTFDYPHKPGTKE